MANKPFYYEGNYCRNFGNDVHYAILTIEQGNFTLEEIEGDYNIDEIEISEKTKGNFLVEYGSNMSGTEEISFCDSIEEAMLEYERMEEEYCDNMGRLSKPLEELIINKEPIPQFMTPAQKEIAKHIESGDLVYIS